MARTSLYDVQIKDLQGNAIHFSEYKDKHLLFVNVASKCGFTPQYESLEKLSNTYKNNLVVIGVPCNQFGKQEPGNADEIGVFCQVNYGVSFLMTEKIEVKGENQHPLYKWLTLRSLNGKKSSSVRWNFQKYLIGPEGKLIDYFFSITKPFSSKITKNLRY